MRQLTVRNVPDDVMEALRDEAAQGGRSVNAVARSALREHIDHRQSRMRLAAHLPAMDALRARIEERAGGPLSSSAPLIREDRER